MSTVADLHMELVDARTDARELSDLALLREPKLAGVARIRDRDWLVEAVARSWVGLLPDERHGA